MNGPFRLQYVGATRKYSLSLAYVALSFEQQVLRPAKI